MSPEMTALVAQLTRERDELTTTLAVLARTFGVAVTITAPRAARPADEVTAARARSLHKTAQAMSMLQLTTPMRRAVGRPRKVLGAPKMAYGEQSKAVLAGMTTEVSRTTRDIAEELGLSLNAARLTLGRLVKIGLLERVGEGVFRKRDEQAVLAAKRAAVSPHHRTVLDLLAQGIMAPTELARRLPPGQTPNRVSGIMLDLKKKGLVTWHGIGDWRVVGAPPVEEALPFDEPTPAAPTPVTAPNGSSVTDRILATLASGPLTTKEIIARDPSLKPKTVSVSMSALQRKALIRRTKDGQWAQGAKAALRHASANGHA